MRWPDTFSEGPDGTIYISDGYVNSRVAKISKDGDWIKSWGQRGKGQGEFNLVHSIATDAKGSVYVADRNNRRIQVFDGDGNFQREIKINVPFDENAKPAIGDKPNLTNYLQSGGSMTPGAPWAICITPGPNQVLYSADSYPGRIYKLSLDGKVLGVLGSSVMKLSFGAGLRWTALVALVAVAFVPLATSLNVRAVPGWGVPGWGVVTEPPGRGRGAGAGVTGAGFITLAATLSIVPSVPVAGMALILGVDRFMSECRSLTNFIGNAVATVVVSRWEGKLDAEQLHAALSGRAPRVDQQAADAIHAG